MVLVAYVDGAAFGGARGYQGVPVVSAKKIPLVNGTGMLCSPASSARGEAPCREVNSCHL
ncbi:hypothetical protein WME75_17585 [Sorangium sp. So ce1014]|uniref:hypothetical protein n=1 Tax=Sorangium sp. So ce1014 TaxID=3133326 RepID=UPI003F5DC77B